MQNVFIETSHLICYWQTQFIVKQKCEKKIDKSKEENRKMEAI